MQSSSTMSAPMRAAWDRRQKAERERVLIEHARDEMVPVSLSFENHQRQFVLLMYVHAPLALAVLILAVVGGHMHTVNAVFFVYLVLFAAFALSVVVIGLPTQRMWIYRAFSLAMFGISLWSTLSVVYAVYTQIRMRQWYDILLLCLQGFDVLVTIAYFWTAEMMAGLGGEVSAQSNSLHAQDLVRSPIADQLPSAADHNAQLLRGTVVQRTLSTITSAVSAAPARTRRKQATD